MCAELIGNVFCNHASTRLHMLQLDAVTTFFMYIVIFIFTCYIQYIFAYLRLSLGRIGNPLLESFQRPATLFGRLDFQCTSKETPSICFTAATAWGVVGPCNTKVASEKMPLQPCDDFLVCPRYSRFTQFIRWSTWRRVEFYRPL